MIKLKGERDGKPFLMLGIDAENVRRLKQGKPIAIRGKDVNLDLDVFIMYGATVKDIYRELKAAGLDLPMPKIGGGWEQQP